MINYVSIKFTVFTYPDYDERIIDCTHFFKDGVGELSEWEIEEEIENIIVNPDNYNNNISSIASEHFGNIKNWEITFLGDISDLEEFTNFKDTSVSLFVEMPMFTNINIWDTEKLYILYSERFNKAYNNLNFDDLMSVSSNFKIEKCNTDTGIVISFSFEYDVFLYLYKHNFNFNSVYHEKSNDTVCISENKNNVIKNNNVSGNIAFLEGSYHLDESYSVIIDDLNTKQGSYITITDLYKEPEKLALLVKYDIKTIVFKTTGFNSDLEKIISAFKLLNYNPDNIIILGNNILGTDLKKYGITSNLYLSS